MDVRQGSIVQDAIGTTEIPKKTDNTRELTQGSTSDSYGLGDGALVKPEKTLTKEQNATDNN